MAPKTKIPISSFARTLTNRIMLVLLVMMAVTTAVAYFFVKSHMAEESEDRYHLVLLQTHEQIRTMLSDIYVAIENNVSEVERDIDQPDLMYSHVERIVRKNPRMVGCGIIFEENHFPEKGRWFEVYASQDSVNPIRARQIGSESHDYLQADWYKRTMSMDEGDWTDPYFDNAGARQLLISYMTQIHDKQGRKVGILGADVSIDWLRLKLKEIDEKNNQRFESNISRKSYSFVVDRNGAYVIHPDPSRILTSNFFEEANLTPDTLDNLLSRRMVSEIEGDCRLKIEGIPSHVFFHRVKNAEWSLVTVVPDKIIYRNGRLLGLILLGVTLLGLAAIYFISRRTIKRTSKPLTDYAAQAASVEKELVIAHDIQMAMLPETSSLLTPTTNATIDHLKSLQGQIKSPAIGADDFEIYALLTPAHEVGGDFYDYILRDEKLFFCIGDVSGKGIPASLVMSMAQTSFRFLVSRESAPDSIVNQMNDVMARDNEYNSFITFFVGVLDLPTGRLRYTNAGHKPPMVINEEGTGAEKSFQSLPVDSNLPIGAFSDWTYTAQEMVLSPDTTIFLYTDGLNEAENAQSEQFGTRRIEETIRTAASQITPKSLIETMTRAVHSFVGTTEQSDDLTMLSIRYTRRHQADSLHRSLILPNDVQETPRLGEFVEDICEKLAFDATTTMQINLAIEEAVVNVMNYAYPHGMEGNVEIIADANSQRLKFTIIDSGKAFDPTTSRPVDTTLDAEDRAIGGLGIHLMRVYMDSINYERRNGQNILTLRKRL